MDKDESRKKQHKKIIENFKDNEFVHAFNKNTLKWEEQGLLSPEAHEKDPPKDD